MTNSDRVTAGDRYLRHDLIDWFDQARVHASRVAVIGAGAIGNEVVKNLALLGVGNIDVFDFDRIEIHNLTRGVFFREEDVGRSKVEVVAERAGALDPNVTITPIEGDFWDTLGLTRLRSYDCVIAAVDNFEARIRLNQMCALTGVALVNAGIDSRYASVEVFPSMAGCACYECHLPASAYARIAERYSCGWLKRRGHAERKIPTTTITASFAGALAASAALRLGGELTQSRRVLFDTLAGSSSVSNLVRQADCVGCGRFESRPRIVPGLPILTAQLTPADQRDVAIELSDPIIAAWRCSRCGNESRAAELTGRRASDFDDAITLCERCNAHSVHVEIRDQFSLGELQALFELIGRSERFSLSASSESRPLSVKYVLASIGGERLCIDLHGGRNDERSQ